MDNEDSATFAHRAFERQIFERKAVEMARDKGYWRIVDLYSLTAIRRGDAAIYLDSLQSDLLPGERITA